MVKTFKDVKEAINYFSEDYPDGYDRLKGYLRIEAEERMIYLHELRVINIRGLDNDIG